MGQRRKKMVSPGLIRSIFGDSLIAYYPLAGDGQDYSGNGAADIALTNVTWATSLAPGLPGKCAYFNGTDAYGVIPATAMSPLISALDSTQSGTILAVVQSATDADFIAHYTDGNEPFFALQVHTRVFTAGSYGDFSCPLRDDDGSAAGNGNHEIVATGVASQLPALAGVTFRDVDANDASLVFNGQLVGAYTTTGSNALSTWTTDFPLGLGATIANDGSVVAYAESYISHVILLDRAISEREAKLLADLSGIESPPAYNIPGYVSAYPTPTTIAIAPEFLIDAAGEPNAPSVGTGDESPTNLGKMFGATSLDVSQDAAGSRPVWDGDRWAINGSQWWYQSGVSVPDVLVLFGVIKLNGGGQGLFGLRDLDSAPNVALATSSSSDNNYSYYIVASNGSSGSATYLPTLRAGDEIAFVARVTLRPVSGDVEYDLWATDGDVTEHGSGTTTDTFPDGLTTDFVVGAVEADGTLPGTGHIKGLKAKFFDIADRPSDSKMETLRDELAAKWGIT